MNPLKAAWERGEKTLGVWCTLPGSTHAEMVARQGVDYVCVDYQHGMIDHSVGVQMMQAILAGGAIPIARPGWNEPARIMQALDAGVAGVVVPMVNNASEATAAVAATRFPPRGSRSYGPVRAREVIGSADPATLEDVACMVMIETEQGIVNARSIIRTEGVTGVYIGPSDLGLAMGFTPGTYPHDERMLDFLRSVVDECREAGKVPGIQAANGDIARDYAELGFDMITIASDAPLLTGAVRSHLSRARGSELSVAATTTSNY